jgi:hypothetical protein
VEDKQICQLQRIWGLSLITLEPPPPPLRRRLDQEGSFEMNGPQESVPEPALRGYFSTLKEPTISYLQAEALRIANPPITNLSTPILIHIVPPEVTPSKCQLILQVLMEENDANSFESPHTLIMTTIAGGILPPLPPSLVKNTVVSTPSNLENGPRLLSSSTTAPFTQSAMGPPFSYGMPDFDSNSVLT